MKPDVPATGIYFASYEFFQDQLTPEGGTRKDLGPLQILLAGGGAGVCNWVGAIAPDTLKSRLQTAPEGMYKRGVRSVFVDIVKTEGPTALFKGLTPVMLRAFPANAVSINQLSTIDNCARYPTTWFCTDECEYC
ncbi:mitochondrial carnitine/acylcarnitine carrier protein-like [Tubulanus polymorphus]|uniref:mitochondrial carnitine/acylcarnitine carrier protein-like n=1 Tax=Tubulanus polymorphus TaxID=672921 RepID=UPI003DA639A8